MVVVGKGGGVGVEGKVGGGRIGVVVVGVGLGGGGGLCLFSHHFLGCAAEDVIIGRRRRDCDSIMPAVSKPLKQNQLVIMASFSLWGFARIIPFVISPSLSDTTRIEIK